MANKTDKTELKKVNIVDKLEAERAVEPVIVDKDNGTQSFEDSKTEKVTAPEQVEGAAAMDNSGTEGPFVDYIETPVVVREKRIITEGLSKAQLKDYAEKLEKSNPKKYAAKKDELDRKIKEAK